MPSASVIYECTGPGAIAIGDKGHQCHRREEYRDKVQVDCDRMRNFSSQYDRCDRDRDRSQQSDC